MAVHLFGSGRRLAGGASVKIHEVITQLALGAGIGIIADAVVEITRFPVLNDTGTFGNTKVSNFELFFYGVSIAGIAAGIIDIGWGRGVLTFSRSMIFYLAGLIFGVSIYESTLSTMFGIRKFNPYQVVAANIPAVLPANTQLPFVTPGATPTGFQTAGGGAGALNIPGVSQATGYLQAPTRPIVPGLMARIRR